MESVGARKRRRTEAGLAYDESMKKSRSLSEVPRCPQERTSSLNNENETTPASQTSTEIITGGKEIVESTEVDAVFVDGNPSEPNSAGNSIDSSVFNLSEENSVCLVTNYSLNEKNAYIKKKNACSRENFTVVRNNSLDSITFNTTAFEIFRKCFDRYYQYHQDKYHLHRTPVIDKNNNVVVQDIIRVTDPRKSGALVYTVNIYRTTSRTMVNGSEHARFVDVDLPCITNLISQEDDNIRECNVILHNELCSRISDLSVKKGTHGIAGLPLIEHPDSVQSSAESEDEFSIDDSPETPQSSHSPRQQQSTD